MSELTHYKPQTVTVHSDRDGGTTYTLNRAEDTNPSTPWAIILILLAVVLAVLGPVITELARLAALVESNPIGFAAVTLILAAAVSLLISVFRGN